MLKWWQGDQDVYSLIARKNYPKAIKLLERELRKAPRSIHLRQLLADVLTLQGERRRAISVLEPLVDEFTAAGFVPKAIAVLKKIQRIDSERSDIDLKLAALIEERESKAPRGPARPPLPEVGSDAAEHLPAEPPADTLGEGESVLPTSELRTNWFEEALARHQEFHWSPLLSGFSKEELAALIGGLRLLIKKPGAIIYGEDEPGESLFILASGKARVYRRNGVGHYQQVAVRREGDIFGEGSVLTVSNRRSTVTAATECELLELDRETFDRISRRYPRVCDTIRQLYESRIAREAVSWG